MSENRESDQAQDHLPTNTNDEPPPGSESLNENSHSKSKLDAGGELENARKEIRGLQAELDEARSLVAVANYSLEESLETERRKCREEVATLHQLMRGLFDISLDCSVILYCLMFNQRKHRGGCERNTGAQ